MEFSVYGEPSGFGVSGGLLVQNRLSHPLIRDAQFYAAATEDWLNSHPAILSRLDFLDRFGNGSVDSSVRSSGVLKGALAAVETIVWNRVLIRVELLRALSLKEYSGAKDDAPDPDGLVKLVLLSIEQSIRAWIELVERLDISADSILDLINKLEELADSVEGLFPSARRFARPGFELH